MLAKIGLKRTTLPPIESCLLCQLTILLLNLETSGLDMSLLLGFVPTGIPRKIKEDKPISQFRKEAPAWINSRSRFTPKSLLLFKFTRNPETSSKPLRMALKVQR